MNQQIINAFKYLRFWSRGGLRAPNKPLLLLLMLGKYQRSQPRMAPYREVDSELRQLLIDFGPHRQSYHSGYPFWRLQNDGIWELQNAELCGARKGNTDAKKNELLKFDVKGGVTKSIYDAFRADGRLLQQVAELLLSSEFSESLHQDILSAVGLDLNIRTASNRDPEFRRRILSIYSYKCALCSYGIRFSDSVIGLEAAHIKWHQAGGPSTPQNGLALCSVHHKLFDYGAFTLNYNLQIVLSRDVHGEGLENYLLRHEGSKINSPHNEMQSPDQKYLNWHRNEVFKAPAR